MHFLASDVVSQDFRSEYTGDLITAEIKLYFVLIKILLKHIYRIYTVYDICI